MVVWWRKGDGAKNKCSARAEVRGGQYSVSTVLGRSDLDTCKWGGTKLYCLRLTVELWDCGVGHHRSAEHFILQRIS